MGYFLAIIALIVAFDSNPPQTELILLDNNSTHNRITINKGNQQRVLDKPYTYVTISGEKDTLSKIKTTTKEEVEKKYGSLIHKDFATPTSLSFYFKSGSTALTPHSQKDLPKIISEIKKHYPCNVTIIGHSDRQGDDEANMRLSIKRAKFIQGWLLKQNPKIKTLDVKSYGEKDPIIPTADGVAEPKNRRVEVLIR